MRASILILLVLAASCGADETAIKQQEDAKLSAAVQAEEAKVPETLERIKAESQDRIHGRTTVTADTVPQEQPPPAAPQTQAMYPHSIQVGAFATEPDAERSVREWTARGFEDVRIIRRDPQTSTYPYAVRLFGYDGYAATRTEADRINQRFGIGSFPVQERP